ncbi:MAG: helix-turn-helix domain-containing protein [Gammaproteobacteria bacterium]|nr:helix-turn-helix domain-containing protein [Gammaproteobacteria bacterium]
MKLPLASRLLIAARRGSALTQRQLARRARTSQSVIARVEKGTVSPSWRTLERLLHCAGFELRATLLPRIASRSHMLADVPRILQLTPEERLLELRNAARFFAGSRRIGHGRL